MSCWLREEERRVARQCYQGRKRIRFWYEDLERVIPDTPAAQWCMKKVHRQKGQGEKLDQMRKSGIGEGRIDQQKSSRSSAVVEQNLFQDSLQGRGADFDPPKGPVVVGLEELILISTQKRAKPKLADRRIQIPGSDCRSSFPRCGNQLQKNWSRRGRTKLRRRKSLTGRGCGNWVLKSRKAMLLNQKRGSSTRESSSSRGHAVQI
jgi:hypothetical protein